MLKDLEVQDVLIHGKALKSINKSRWKKSKLEGEVINTGLSGFAYCSIQFFPEQIESR
jgi:hypothetical protein